MGIQGKTVVFTGKISKPRHEFQKMVEEHGGIAGADVSSRTDYLVVGEKPGSKLIRAASLGVKTISEVDFLKLLQDPIEDQETPLSAEELAELDRHLADKTCFFCKRVTKQFDTAPDYDTCFLCETPEVPKCPNCGYKSSQFITDFKLYHCGGCWRWFKAPYSWSAHTLRHLHIWMNKTQVKLGIKEECICGSIRVTKPDGTWLKHEPDYIIEQAKKEAHEHAVEQNKLYHQEIREREAQALEIYESLTPSQQYLLEN